MEEIKMPTFYDPIELEDIDVDDNTAHFYIIKVGENSYKFCATTQNLNSPEMRGGDPETRVRFYWPITREQLNQANFAVLFPNDKMRTSTMTSDVLQNIFHFNPLEQDDRIFGHNLEYDSSQPMSSITWQTRPPQAISDRDRYILSRFDMVYGEHLNELLQQAEMSDKQRASFFWGLNPFSGRDMSLEEALTHKHILFNFLNIYSEKFSFNLLVNFDADTIKSIVSHKMRGSIENGQFTLGQLNNVQQQLHQAGVTQLAVYGVPYTAYILKNPESIACLLNGILTIEDFLIQSQVASQEIERFTPGSGYDNSQRPEILLSPLCMMVVKEGCCTAQDLMNLDAAHFFLIAAKPPVLEAIREGRTTLEVLQNLTISDLKEAIRTNQYPAPQAAPGY